MNKFYIQTALFLLSIFAYANNETLAAEHAPGEDTKNQLRSHHTTSEGLYEIKSHLLNTSNNNNTKAVNRMKNAVKQLEYHATSKDGYEVYLQNPNDSISYYVKKFNGQTDILKINLNIYASSQYNHIINRLWDPNSPSIFNNGDVKILHVYNPNLVLMRQICKEDSKHHRKYFYVLVSKDEISKDKTIIAMTSVDVNEYHRKNQGLYNNPILGNEHSFVEFLNPKDYITIRKFAKVYVNLAGYLIEKKGDNLEITYIESIKGHSSI
ncbi:fam-a protein [Plasmodium vinckei petteri]|uniref:Fam-a protein n=1 Tax=Plasmodium vinckei petteri TaxID=138298 RepID=A0A6V7T6V8_PLAVN|nr:fam-a protein [Plasmodium vinckei petteri]